MQFRQVRHVCNECSARIANSQFRAVRDRRAITAVAHHFHIEAKRDDRRFRPSRGGVEIAVLFEIGTQRLDTVMCRHLNWRRARHDGKEAAVDFHQRNLLLLVITDCLATFCRDRKRKPEARAPFAER